MAFFSKIYQICHSCHKIRVHRDGSLDFVPTGASPNRCWWEALLVLFPRTPWESLGCHPAHGCTGSAWPMLPSPTPQFCSRLSSCLPIWWASFWPTAVLPPPFAGQQSWGGRPPTLQLADPSIGPDVPVWHNILAMLPYLEAVVPIQGKPFFQRLLWWAWWPLWQLQLLWLCWGAPQPWRLWWCGWLGLCHTAAGAGTAQADILHVIHFPFFFGWFCPFSKGPPFTTTSRYLGCFFCCSSACFFSCCFFLFDFFSSQLCSGSGSASLAEAPSCLAAVLLCAVLLCAVSSCLFSKGWAAFFSSLSTTPMASSSVFSVFCHLFHLSCFHLSFLLVFLMLLLFFPKPGLSSSAIFPMACLAAGFHLFAFFSKGCGNSAGFPSANSCCFFCIFFQGLLGIWLHGLPSQLPCPAGGPFPLESSLGIVGLPPFIIILPFFGIPFVLGHALFSRAVSLYVKGYPCPKGLFWQCWGEKKKLVWARKGCRKHIQFPTRALEHMDMKPSDKHSLHNHLFIFKQTTSPNKILCLVQVGPNMFIEEFSYPNPSQQLHPFFNSK